VRTLAAEPCMCTPHRTPSCQPSGVRLHSHERRCASGGSPAGAPCWPARRAMVAMAASAARRLRLADAVRLAALLAHAAAHYSAFPPSCRAKPPATSLGTERLAAIARRAYSDSVRGGRPLRTPCVLKSDTGRLPCTGQRVFWARARPADPPFVSCSTWICCSASTRAALIYSTASVPGGAHCEEQPADTNATFGVCDATWRPAKFWSDLVELYARR
jgi:hypothetical protein